MLFILRSTSLLSSVIAASPLVCGPVTVDPDDLAEPVVTPLPVLARDPDDCEVPAVLVPGAGLTPGAGDACLDAFPAPLGSSPALLSPPGAAGPEGTPLTPCDPAPAEPALGEPVALPLLLPADDPPPPELWAKEATGNARIAIAVIVAAADASFMEISFSEQRQQAPLVPARNHSVAISLGSICTPSGVTALAQIDCLRR
jgi:hypothetical protein